MRRALLALLTVICFCAAGASIVYADGESGDDKAQAQQHYNAGLRAYNLGDFDRAITEWKTAYQFLGVPDFLFNIAQAYRQKRDYEEAVFFYNAYLRGKPNAPNVAEVTALRDEMKTLREQELKNEQMAPEPKELLGPNGERTEMPPASDTNTTTAPRSVAVTAPETSLATAPETNDTSAPASAIDEGYGSGSDDGRTLRLTGIAVGGAGVAFVATGIVFALSASSAQDELETAAANQEPWSDAFADLEDGADRDASVGTFLIAAGAVGVVAGGVTYFLGHRKGEKARRTSGLQVLPTFSTGKGTAQAGLAVGLDF